MEVETGGIGGQVVLDDPQQPGRGRLQAPTLRKTRTGAPT